MYSSLVAPGTNLPVVSSGHNSLQDALTNLDTDQQSSLAYSVSEHLVNLPGQQTGSETRNVSDLRREMEEQLKRSVTIIFWYKANVQPIRLNHPISTFPFVQVSHFPALVSDLGLTATSYVDSYSAQSGHWETHMISTVRVVESEQVLLYRVRKSLLEGLSDEDCVGIVDEVAKQMKPRAKPKPTSLLTPQGSPNEGSLKRSAPEALEPTPVTKHHAAENYQKESPTHLDYLTPSSNQRFPQGPSRCTPSPTPTPIASTSSSPSSNYIFQTQRMGLSPTLSNGTPIPAHLTSPHSPKPPIPYHPHPPLKRWPNDYTVSEIASGFTLMDSLIAATPTLTQRVVFERVFGCRYVKSTVCRHRALWRRAEKSVKEAFEAMGADERAVWGEFVKRAEGRVHSRTNGQGKASNGEAGAGVEQGDVAEAVVEPDLANGPAEEEEEIVQDPILVMGPFSPSPSEAPNPHEAPPSTPVTSLVLPGSIPQNGYVAVYDPALTANSEDMQT